MPIIAMSLRARTGSIPNAAANAALEISSSPAAMRSRIRRKYAGYRRIVGSGSGSCLSTSFIGGELYHISGVRKTHAEKLWIFYYRYLTIDTKSAILRAVFTPTRDFREQTEEGKMNDNERPDAADGGVAELEAQIARVRAAQAKYSS